MAKKEAEVVQPKISALSSFEDVIAEVKASMGAGKKFLELDEINADHRRELISLGLKVVYVEPNESTKVRIEF